MFRDSMTAFMYIYTYKHTKRITKVYDVYNILCCVLQYETHCLFSYSMLYFIATLTMNSWFEPIMIWAINFVMMLIKSDIDSLNIRALRSFYLYVSPKLMYVSQNIYILQKRTQIFIAKSNFGQQNKIQNLFYCVISSSYFI